MITKKEKLSEQYLKIKMKKNILVWQFFEINQSKLIKYIERNKHIRCYKNSFGKLKKNDLGSYLINIDYLLKNYSLIPNKYKKIHENIHTKLFEKYSKHIYCFNLIGISKKNFNPYDFSKILSCQINCIISFFREKKINYLISSPYLCIGHDFLVYYVAKYLNIKTLLVVSQFRNKFFCTTDLTDFGKFKSIPKNLFDTINSDFKVSKFGEPYYSSILDKNIFYLKNKNQFFLKLFLPHPKRIFKSNGISQYIKKLKNTEENIKIYKFWKIENSRKSILNKLPKKFCLFALQYQPEASTLGIGRSYDDQVNAIEKLREKLPRDIYIIIKEHPAQSDYSLRSKIFYRRLKILKNVVFTNTNDNTELLAKKSLFIATVTGTIALEAILNRKPAIVFGRPWFLDFDGIFSFQKIFNLKKILKKKISLKKINYQFSTLSSKMGSGVDSSIGWNNAVDFTSNFKKVKYDENKNCELLTGSILKIINSKKVKWISSKKIY